MKRIDDYTPVQLADYEIKALAKRLGEFIQEPGGWSRCPHSERRYDTALISQCWRAVKEVEIARRNAGKQPEQAKENE